MTLVEGRSVRQIRDGPTTGLVGPSAACDHAAIASDTIRRRVDEADRVLLRVEVLGPLRLVVDGEDIEVRGTRRRAMLALLALQVGQVVSVDTLLDVLWEGEPPPSGRHAVRSLLSRVRGHLAGHADHIEQVGGGYRLDRAVWDVDVLDVRDKARRARSAAVTDPSEAAVLLESALQHWRGPALAEFASIDSLAAHALTLHELRLSLEDELIAACLDSGGTDLVERTVRAVQTEPLREQRQLLHIRALATASRATEALRAASAYRKRLADETGLDPTPALAALESQVASGELAPRRDEADRAAPRLPASGDRQRTDQIGLLGRWPRALTPLLGRATELERLQHLLGSEALVSVVGPGGIGKTRLATTAAQVLHDQGERTVVYVALAQLDSGMGLDTVAGAVAGAVGLRPNRNHSALEVTQEWLGTGRYVLILDNCEHLIDAVRDLVVGLLSARGDPHILLTSRMPTALPGEHLLRLGPLPRCSTSSPDDLADQPAVRLFIDRARRGRDRFQPSPDQLRSIAETVDRLDGLPLAIELAAARLSTLSLDDLVARLDDALDLLTDGRPSVDARQRSLRATLDWSYRLLGPDERRLLTHLGAFADGADLAAVETVGSALGLRGAGVNELASLVDSSIVQVEGDDTPRYRMPESVRAFARDRHLRHGGDATPTGTLIRWAVETATEIDHLCRDQREPDADRQIRREIGNLRAAHLAATETDDLDAAVAITVALDRAAAVRDLPEVWTWARQLAARPDLDGHPRQAEALGAAAEAAWLVGDLADSERDARHGLDIDPSAGRCIYALATVALFRGQTDRARSLFVDAADTDRAAFGNAALAAAYNGDRDEAEHLIAAGMPWAETQGAPTDLAVFHYATGETRAPDEGAIASYERAVELARTSGATFVEGIATVGLASLLAAQGDTGTALESYRRLVNYWARTGSWTQQWITLANLARLLRDLGDGETAATIDHAARGSGDPALAPPQPTPPSDPRTTAPSRAKVVHAALRAIDEQLHH